MSTQPRGPYQMRIRRITKCSAEDGPIIEEIMRNDVLHTVALDWLSPAAFRKAALDAARLLDANRVEYEEYFAGARKAFEEMKASGIART